MAYVWQRWLADDFRAAGLKVVEVEGWKNRGRPASTGNFDPRGPVTNHHTGTKTGWTRLIPTLMTIIKGRPDLPGPLAQWTVGYDGTVYVVAAGRANHAGRVGKRGVTGMPLGADGNALALGDEVDTNGTQTMPAAQRKAIAIANAVVLKHYKRGTDYVHRHEDISGTGKWDIGSISTSRLRTDAGAELQRLNTPKWVPQVGIRSDLSKIQEQFQIVQGMRTGEIVRYNGVGRIQQELNERGASLTVDGLCDAATVAAWRKWEASLPPEKRSGSAGTPDPKSLAPMGLIFSGPEAVLPKVRVRIGIHNVYVKRAVAEVNATYSALLAKVRPHAVLLQETAQMYGKWNIPGYKVIQFAPKRIHEGHVIETSSNTVLVRNDVAVEFKGLLDLDETWKGPKVGAMHDPRAPITTTITVGGKDVRLLDVHGPFTPDAVAEFNAAVVDWIETSPYPAMAGGDYNQSFDNVVEKIARPAGATANGKAPDMVVWEDMDLVESENHGKQGSDTHYFKTFDMDV